jgi:hypothetical protein
MHLAVLQAPTTAACRCAVYCLQAKPCSCPATAPPQNHHQTSSHTHFCRPPSCQLQHTTADVHRQALLLLPAACCACRPGSCRPLGLAGCCWWVWNGILQRHVEHLKSCKAAALQELKCGGSTLHARPSTELVNPGGSDMASLSAMFST